MKFLALSETGAGEPCFFRQFLREDGYEVIEQSYAAFGDPGAESKSDAVLATGLQTYLSGEGFDEAAWARATHAIGRLVVGAGVPFLGFGLGHIAFAGAIECELTGAAPQLSENGGTTEVEVRLTADGASGIFFDGVGEVFTADQCAVKQVRVIPAFSKCLATSDTLPLQAMSWETRAFGCSFNLNMPRSEARPEARKEQHPPAGSAPVQSRETVAERLYMNWLQTMAK